MANEVSDELKSKVRNAISKDGKPPRKEIPKLEGFKALMGRRFQAEVTLFVRQLAVLFDGGLPLHQAVELIAKRTTSKNLKGPLQTVSADVTKGTPLWKAMAGFPHIFDKLTVTLVKAGEESGEATKTLDLLADSMEFGEEMERKVLNVMLFPLISIVIALSVLLFLLVVIFPSMAERFQDIDADLPFITNLIWGIGVNIQSYWFVYVILLGGLVGAVIWFAKSKGEMFEFLKLRVPLVGKIIAMAAISRLAKTLSILLEAGFSTPDALELARDTVNNKIIAGVVDEARQRAEAGSSFAEPFGRHWVVPEMTADIMAIGEETGNLPKLLGHLAKLFEVRVNTAADRLITILEPVLTLVVASITLVVALAMFLPYFSLFTQGIGGG